MGFRNFGSLLMIFLILMLVFGTQRLRDVGNDLGIAIRNFRKGLQDNFDDTNRDFNGDESTRDANSANAATNKEGKPN